MATRSSPGDADHPLFRYPRDFDRETENRPFLDDSDDADSESSDDDSDSESGEGPDDEVVEINRVSSAVRRLSRKLVTDQPSPDSYQDAQVVKFVENGPRPTPGSRKGNDQPLVALIDDQTDTVGGQSCRGGLTRSGLVEVLKKQRFTDPSVAPGHSEGDPADINRRVIGVPGLAAPEMEVLAENATKSQKDALLKFYRHHINPSPSIECDMPSSGFRTLSLQFHVPYMVLRQHRKPRKDPRQKPNGDPLRGSWPVGCIPATKPRAQWHLHQAQRSLAVVVIAKRVWTAFGTTDIFFDGSKCKDSVAYRHDLWAKDELRDRVAMDPMRSWRVYVLGTDGVRDEGSDGDLLSDPWLYFLAMLEWAMTVAQCEYAPILTELQEAVNNGYPVDATEQAQDLEGKWNADALEHIRRIMTCLGDLLDAWKTFQSEDPRFLDVDINARYLPSIKRSFNTLEKYHKQLAELKKKLKRNEAKIKQQLHVQVRDAQSYAQTLAILIIVFSPLSQVMSLFNMQGLPFALTPASFALSLVGIGCMWVVVYWIVMRGITVTRLWRVYVGRCLGHVTARIWERVLSLVPRGKLEEVVEHQGPPALGGPPSLGGSTVLGGSTAALWESLQAITANTLPRRATWPMFPPRRGNESHEDPGLTV